MIALFNQTKETSILLVVQTFYACLFLAFVINYILIVEYS